VVRNLPAIRKLFFDVKLVEAIARWPTNITAFATPAKFSLGAAEI